MRIADRQAKRLLLITGAAIFLAGCSDKALVQCGEAFPFTGPADTEFLLLAEAIGGKVRVPAPVRASSADSRSDVPAYQFVVDRVANGRVFRPGPPPVIDFGSSPFTQSDTVLVVPWLHDKDCTPVVWDREDWIPESTTVVFRISEGRFYRGRFVFDAFAAYSPYPVASALGDAANSGAYRDGENWMTALEFFEMMRQLPNLDPTLTRAEQLQSLEGRFRTGPTHWVDKFPGLEIVRRAREWAAMEGDGVSTP